MIIHTMLVIKKGLMNVIGVQEFITNIYNEI